MVQWPHKFTDFLCQFYGLDGAPPKVHLIRSDEFEAYSTSDGGLFVSIGILRQGLWIEQRLRESGMKHAPEAFYGDVPGILTCWVTAHEFFHYGRSHFQFSDFDQLLCHVLEFDADTMAVDAVYYYHSLHMNGDFSSRENLKRTILHAIYWPIRQRFHSAIEATEATATHPSWFFRLWNSALKLASMDVETPGGIFTIEWLEQPEFWAEIRPIFAELMVLEGQFDAVMGRPRPNPADLGQFGDYIADAIICQHPPEHEEILQKWLTIEPTISATQLLSRLRLNEHR